MLPQNFAVGEENFAVRNTNGTGPYTLVSRDPEVPTVMTSFEGHWDEAPVVTEIIYTPIVEAATRVAALLSGEVDLVQDVPVQDIARLEQTDGIKVSTGPENRNIFFSNDMVSDTLQSADVDDNPFKKPEVREAMAMSLVLDRDAIPLIENWETDFYLLGWGVPTFDSAYVFNFLVHTREDSFGSFNGSRYSNPELDAKIEALATMTNLAARDALIAEIWDQVMEDRVFLNVHNQMLAYAMLDDINLDVHPENQPKMTTVTFGN